MLSDFAIQLNKNSFGLNPASPLQVSSIPPSGSNDTSLPLVSNSVAVYAQPFNLLQAAVKCSSGIYYFAMNIPLPPLLADDGPISESAFGSLWVDATLPGSQVMVRALPSTETLSRLLKNNFFVVKQMSPEVYNKSFYVQ